MFGRHIRTFLDHIKPNRLVAQNKCEERTTNIQGSRARVDARNDTKRGPKWRFGEVLPRQTTVISHIMMDGNTKFWRRHINQIIEINYKEKSRMFNNNNTSITFVYCVNLLCTISNLILQYNIHSYLSRLSTQSLRQRQHEQARRTGPGGRLRKLSPANHREIKLIHFLLA